MTRQEFIDNVTNFWDLIDWCNEHDCGVCDCVYDDEKYNDYLDEHLVEWARNDTWDELRDYLSNLPSGWDFYQLTDYDEWRSLDDSDFDDFLRDALDWGDFNDIWEEDEEVEEEVEEEAPTDSLDEQEEEPIEAEDVAFADLFAACSSAVQRIIIENEAEKEKEESEAEEEFCEFITGIMAVVEGRA